MKRVRKIRSKRKNPKDEDLLNQVTIKKSYDPIYKNLISYKAFLFNEPIGSLHFNISDQTQTVFVKEEYRRKGISTILYNYVEKDQGIKLKPSKNLSPWGKVFWENRVKKNPTNKNLLKQLEIKKVSVKRGKNKGTIWYHLFINNKHVGTVNYDPIKNEQHIYVKEKFKRQGIGTYIYNLIEKEYGVKLKPSKDVSKEGKLFWKARLKRK